MFFQPENFRSGEAGQNGVAECADGCFQSAELLRDFIAFGGGGGVAPEFGRADDFAVFSSGNKAMLLAADADGFDFGGRDALACSRRSASNGLGGRLRARCADVVPWRRAEGLGLIVSLRSGAENFAVFASTTRTLVDCVPLSIPSKKCSHNSQSAETEV